METPVFDVGVDVRDTYLRNLLRLELPKGTLDVIPCDGESDKPPYGKALFVVSVWNPYGRPSALRENLEWERAAREHPGVEKTASAAVCDEGFGWAERAVALRVADTADVLASRCGQPAYFRWDHRGVTVLETDSERSLARWPVRAVASARGCVMDRAEGADRCQNPGGPWVSASRALGFRWQLDSESRLRALGGCLTCADSPDASGQAIGLVELSVRSRWFPHAVVLGPA